MLLHRKLLLVASCVLVIGSLCASLGYAVYLRSDAYRDRVETKVGEFLKLPTEIGGVSPWSRASRLFHDVSVWLPNRQEQIFSCRRAIWRTVNDQDEASYALELRQGWFLLGTGEFSRSDYQAMLEGGLGRDYGALRLRQVRLDDMEVHWRQPEFEMRIAGASGEVNLSDRSRGSASLSARRLNDAQVDGPITIDAEFTPGARLVVQRAELEVPRVPLSALGLERALGSEITAGWFAGTLSIFDHQDENGPRLRLEGAIGEARLEELTARLSTGPVHGTGDLTIDQAVIVDGDLRELVFRGQLGGIRLSDAAALLSEPDLDGTIDLRVRRAEYRANLLEHLSASGDATDVSLTAVTRLIGRGVVTGKLQVKIDSLVIENEKVRWADIRLDATPPADQPGRIDREIVVQTAERVLGVELGMVGDYLPASVEYARMGCRIRVDGDELTVLGSHGKNGSAILTVRVLGREIAVLHAPKRTFSVDSLVQTVRRQIATRELDRIRQWWRERQNGDKPEVE